MKKYLESPKTANTYADLLALPKNLRTIFCCGKWVLVTTRSWDYEKDAYGYYGYIFEYLTSDRGAQAPVRLTANSEDLFEENFEDASVAGAWMVGMISELS